MRKTVISSLCVLLLLSLAAQAQAPEDKARFAAEQWIVLVDDGQYDESWKEAAKVFQDSVSSSDWQKKTEAERTQLGPRESRKLKDIKPGPGAKGLPGGQYVQVKYQSSFANKKVATETITAVLESDGNWRVAAYSVN
ncbi:MAG TPA: DUF4019 domain-containing protein [Terriglobales bacterium]|nr:DUF4019 domain-containing protein [Terriglobales bacterium]